MYDPKLPFSYKGVIFFVAILMAFIFDVLFSDANVPVLTLIVCGIVVLYERISPFIYSSR